MKKEGYIGSDLVQHNFMSGADTMGSHRTKRSTSLRLFIIIVEILLLINQNILIYIIKKKKK